MEHTKKKIDCPKDGKRRTPIIIRLILGSLPVIAVILAAILLIPKTGAFPRQAAGVTNPSPEEAEISAEPSEEASPVITTEEETAPEVIPSEEPEAPAIGEEDRPQIVQVLLIENGAVAVLYEDGTVRASGDETLALKVADWQGITKLYTYRDFERVGTEYFYEYHIVGLTEEGAVVSTSGYDLDWKGVDELHLDPNGILGVTRDGEVLVHGDWELARSMEGMTGVETLVEDPIFGDFFGCLKKDGTVVFVGKYQDPDKVWWSDAKELHCSGHAFYVIKNDGTVESDAYDDCSGLAGAVKVVPMANDCLLGISADGHLLTHSGGNIYTNSGDMMVAPPGSEYYGGETDIRQYDQVRDIISSSAIYLLNTDGTVSAIHHFPYFGLEGLTGVEKLYVCYSRETYTDTLYGIRADGSVIKLGNIFEEGQHAVDMYRNWTLQEIFTAYDGIVGLTVDGHLVGDGIYADVDFSVFD